MSRRLLRPWLAQGLLTSAVRGPSDPLAALSDNFNSGPIAIEDRGWTRYKPASQAENEVASGRYRIGILAGGAGAANSFWFNATDGLLVYKEVAGDCDMRARTTTWNTAFTGLPGLFAFRLAGIAVHDPDRATVLNYTHAAYGYTGSAYSFETKNTVDSSSVFPVVTIATAVPWVNDLRLVRQGNDVMSYYRAAPVVDLSDDSGWTLHQTFDRSDFPVTCQWGMMVYSNAAVHDVGVDVDEVRFATP